MLFIGDVHAKFDKYTSLLKKYPNEKTFQIGDFGLGFDSIGKLPDKDKFIRGNHDDPQACLDHPNYLGEYGTFTEDGVKFFYLGGAYSIDYAWRKARMLQYPLESQQWWPDEELSVEELTKAREIYSSFKPDVVFTHEAPNEAGFKLLKELLDRPEKLPCCLSRTANYLNEMFHIYKPRLWVFGHYHKTVSFYYKETEFICLDELDTLLLKTKEFNSNSMLISVLGSTVGHNRIIR